MAREQWHRWGQTAITIITLVFVCGISYSKIGHNTTDIGVNTKDIKIVCERIGSVKDDVHRVELDAKDIKALAATAAQASISADKRFESIQTQLIAQGKIQVANSTKLESLIKD